jgi:hypothetical protein
MGVKNMKKKVCNFELEAISSLGLKVARLESLVGEYGDARHISGRLDELEKESRRYRDLALLSAGVIFGIELILIWMFAVVLVHG